MIDEIEKENNSNTLGFEEKYEKGFRRIALELKREGKNDEELKVISAFFEKYPRSPNTEKPDYFDYFKEINSYMKSNGAEKTRSLFQRLYDKSYEIREELTKEQIKRKIESSKYADMYHNPLVSKMIEARSVLKAIDGREEDRPYVKILKDSGNNHAEEFIKKTKFKDMI